MERCLACPWQSHYRWKFSSFPGMLILSWTNAAFNLQATAESSGVYTNIPAATSPYTNNITGSRQFFRLASP